MFEAVQKYRRAFNYDGSQVSHFDEGNQVQLTEEPRQWISNYSGSSYHTMEFTVHTARRGVPVRWVYPNAPLTLKCHVYYVYISKITSVPMSKKHFQKRTLFFNNFCIQYPNATFFGVLEGLFSLANKNI